MSAVRVSRRATSPSSRLQSCSGDSGDRREGLSGFQAYGTALPAQRSAGPLGSHAGRHPHEVCTRPKKQHGCGDTCQHHLPARSTTAQHELHSMHSTACTAPALACITSSHEQPDAQASTRPASRRSTAMGDCTECRIWQDRAGEGKGRGSETGPGGCPRRGALIGHGQWRHGMGPRRHTEPQRSSAPSPAARTAPGASPPAPAPSLPRARWQGTPSRLWGATRSRWR